MRRVAKAFQIVRHLGFTHCLFRFFYELEKKSGLLQFKFKRRLWSQLQLQDLVQWKFKADPLSFMHIHRNHGGHFFFAPPNMPKPDANSIVEADDILHNKFRYFSNSSYPLGTKPDWFLNPITGKRANPNIHWSKFNLFDPAIGDIKIIWEPSRFSWAFSLVRAFAASGDEQYAEKFWLLFDSWCEANQPNIGPNYACGQECAIRLMAICFAFYGFAHAKVTTPQRMSQLAVVIAVHADRINKNIRFAISTRTNHALAEAAGLYTAGLLFPEFRYARQWQKRGKKILTLQGLEQIFPDGSYIQHSMNYHRVMLHIFLWTIQLGRLNSDFFSNALTKRLERATQFLYNMQDESSFGAPNYGGNDGALVLPLNSCDYCDYRPVIQAMHYLLYEKKCYDSGPWDEDLIWLFGISSRRIPIEKHHRQTCNYADGGYYRLHTKQSWAMVRVHTYRTKPAHADMLHLDLWWRGINVLRDSGSYMYYCQNPWQHFFISTAAHNTIEIDGKDQMIKGPRFIWYDWTKSSEPEISTFHTDGLFFLASHMSYKRLGNIVHHRSIASLFNGQIWIIIDDICGSGSHTAKLFWHLVDAPFTSQHHQVNMDTLQGAISIALLSISEFTFNCVRGDDKLPAGYQSLYYAKRSPAPTIIAKVNHHLPIRFTTIISLDYVLKSCSFADNRLTFTSPTNDLYGLSLAGPGNNKNIFKKLTKD